MAPYPGPGNVAASTPATTTASALAISSQFNVRSAGPPPPSLKLFATPHGQGFVAAVCGTTGPLFFGLVPLRISISQVPHQSGAQPCYGGVAHLCLAKANTNAHLLVVKKRVEKSGPVKLRLWLIMSARAHMPYGFGSRNPRLTRPCHHVTLALVVRLQHEQHDACSCKTWHQNTHKDTRP